MATQATSTVRVQPAHRSKLFYPAAAIVGCAIIFLGFARTYYLKEFFGTPALPTLLHLHGIVMTAWMLLLVVQATLVSVRRTDIHRRLGVLGGVLAVAIVAIGVTVGIRSARLGHAPTGIPALSFLAIPLGDMFVFATMVAAAMYYRRRPELHKRLMLIATVAVLPAGIARWPLGAVAHNPIVFFGLADLLFIGCVIYDCIKTRRLSPAYLWGGLVLIASHPLRLMISGTAPWLAFAHWVTRV